VKVAEKSSNLLYDASVSPRSPVPSVPAPYDASVSPRSSPHSPFLVPNALPQERSLVYYGLHFPVLCLSRVEDASIVQACGIDASNDEKFLQFCVGLQGYLPQSDSPEIESEIQAKIQDFLRPSDWAEYKLWHQEVVLPAKWEEVRGWPILLLALQWWTKRRGANYIQASGCSLIQNVPNIRFRFPRGPIDATSDRRRDSGELNASDYYLPRNLADVIEMHRFQYFVSELTLDACETEVREVEAFALDYVIGEQGIQYEGPPITFLDLRSNIRRKLRPWKV
jgi:hypothetical protein